MAVPATYTLWGVKIGATVLDAITAVSEMLNPQVRSERTSGQLYSRFQAMVGLAPLLQWSTLSIAAALDAIGPGGLALTSGAPYTSYAAKRADGGGIAAGSVHRSYTANKGLIVPRTLRVQQGADAQLDYEVITTYDGTNDPLIEADSVALPALGGDGARYTLGPATVGGIALSGLQSLTLDFGLQVKTEASDGDLYPTHCAITAVLPTLRLGGLDATMLGASRIPRTGRAATHANTSVYLRKRAQGGTFVPDLTAEHIACTLDGYATIETARSGDPAQCDLLLRGRGDGTNAPLLVDTTAALP